MTQGTVEIKVHGRFREIFEQVRFSHEIQVGETVKSLISNLGLPNEAPDLWVLVDHVPAERDQVLEPGNLVVFFQPVAGG